MIEAMPIEKAKEIAALANEQFNALPPETIAAYWRVGGVVGKMISLAIKAGGNTKE